MIAIAIITTISVYLLHLIQKKGAPRLCLGRFFAHSKIHNYFDLKESKVVEKGEIEEEICAICYKSINEKILMEKDIQAPYLSTKVKAYIARKGIQLMRTPCQHVFHAVCLLTSMSYKMMCPNCRTRLPNVF